MQKMKFTYTHSDLLCLVHMIVYELCFRLMQNSIPTIYKSTIIFEYSSFLRSMSSPKMFVIASSSSFMVLFSLSSMYSSSQYLDGGVSHSSLFYLLVIRSSFLTISIYTSYSAVFIGVSKSLKKKSKLLKRVSQQCMRIPSICSSICVEGTSNVNKGPLLLAIAFSLTSDRLCRAHGNPC